MTSTELARHRAALTEAGLDADAAERLARVALDEDLDGGVDVTSVATVPESQVARLDLTAREAGVVAGAPLAALVVAVAAERAGVPVEVEVRVVDGTRVQRGDVVVSAVGPTQVLLTAERTALNLLCHLSGVATLTRRWVDAVEGTGAAIRDTRKTTPTMRALEKHAVRCGGGVNHRMSLSDAALVKDNHVVAAGGVAAAFAKVRERFPGLPVEVEVDDLAGAVEAVEAGADLILLDNFDVAALREAVAVVAGRARLESSGGLTLDNARAVAETGVDYLAVGALTHSAPVLDLGADLHQPTGDEGV
jgi:nicotinate-nucleotide pyrophosphorylase (carboxylating)